MSAIPQRLREIANIVHEHGLTGSYAKLMSIAAELEATAVDVVPAVASTGKVRALVDRIENEYGFTCDAGPLFHCSDWRDLRKLLGLE